MHVSVIVNDRHRLRFEANTKSDETVDVRLVSSHVDLRPGDRFIHFLDPRNCEQIDRTLLPLKAQTHDVFRQLDFLESSSPLVQALRQYQEDRLPYVLQRLYDKVPSTPLISTEDSVVHQMLQELRHDPQRAAQVLTRLIASIDDSIPHFFNTEKDLGTFPWLLSGGRRKLPFTISHDDQSNQLSMPCGFANPKETNVPFQINTQTAFFPHDVRPDAVELIEQLCMGGVCGEPLRLVNRAAAMQLMTLELKTDIDRAQAEVARLSSSWAPHKLVFMATTAFNTVVGSVGVLGGLAAGFQLLGLEAPLSTLGTLAAGAVATFSAGALQRMANATRRKQAKLDANKLDQELLFLEQADAETQSILAATLLRYIDARGAGRTQTLLAPISARIWESEFSGMDLIDQRVYRHADPYGLFGNIPVGTSETVVRVRVEKPDHHSELSAQVQTEIESLLEPELICLRHTEVADKHWHLMHAIDLCSSFAQRMNLGRAASITLPLRELMANAQKLRCNLSGDFEPISRPFNQLRSLLKVDESAWQFVSRPLFAVQVLESTLDSKRACEIARYEMLRNFMGVQS